MNLTFIWWLKHAGLALAIALGACLNATLLLRGLRRRNIYSPLPGWSVFLVKLGVAVYAMSTVVWFASGPDTEWLAMGAAERALRLGSVVLLGALTYFCALWVLGFRLRDFAREGAP
jgi:putative peptidoglycan lipid II flippase